MNGDLDVWVEGIGVWAPGLPNWDHLCAHLAGQPTAEDAPKRPAAGLLPPAERRRAPDSVRLAVETAAQAVAMSGRDAAELPSVFASAHGDAVIMDYMCETLATTPLEMSPTRFHNSVHNAAAGYWTIATGCHRSSNAICAGDASFGAGLLEATTLAASDAEAVLLAAFDAPGQGPLVEMLSTRTPFACALVLSPQRTPQSRAALRLRLHASGHPQQPPSNAHLRRLARENACGAALTLLEALAQPTAGSTRVAAGTGLTLHIETDVLA
ncbi:beta-ketoacyl synthase chain length factor [Oleiagrimonas soli]|uniref:Beta-ketoacyl synthase-like N-terminal domain-containing protein n=1 Tax=Oleiagrimonas soli TaxID=1543381 RepID=A0A099CSR1_9GAMM|nr:beta-ketoacyl synthase chain length factor [Oleiagrimonas soli]KGI76726.1 hypothetical protein LF63_0114310 [Oleiagrimonas soli]MBB6185042.1 hypothetical protein [Oleiagrimonas soli]